MKKNRTNTRIYFLVMLAVVGISVTQGVSLPASPELMRYQVRLADDAGVPLTGSHDLSFAIHDAASAGNQLWSEGPRALVLQSDILDILLGEVTPLPSSVFTDSGRWIEVTVDGSVLSPRQRLSSIPYAMATDRLGTLTLSEVQADVEARIGTHSALPSAHHVKTTDAAELISGTLDPNRLADGSITAIKLDDGPGSGLDADTLDGIEGGDICLGVSCSRTPQQIAMLRWYEASEVGNTFTVGTFPRAIAFDGSSVWVANRGSSNVTKLRTSDGALLGTFAVGLAPIGVAFDGSSIWVVNSSNTVTKLRASDGALLDTFASGGENPQGVAFDGSSIWVANARPSNTVTKLRAADGVLLDTLAVGDVPAGVAFDGSSIWVPNLFDDTVTKLRAADGAPLGTFAVGNGPFGVAFDGSSIWVPNHFDDTVTKLRAADGAPLGTFAVGDSPIGVAFDGSSIWVANSNSDNVTKLRAADGALLDTFAVGPDPRSIGFDGSSIWVTHENSNIVTKL